MAIKEVISESNSYIDDIRDTLLSGGAKWTLPVGAPNGNVLGNYFTREAKVNPWTEKRPYDRRIKVNGTNSIFVNTINRKQYTAGNKPPKDCYYHVKLPVGGKDSPYILGDFRGYKKDDYTFKTDFSIIPSNIKIGFGSIKIDVGSNGSKFPYFLVGQEEPGTVFWGTATLLICEKQGAETKCFISTTVKYPTPSGTYKFEVNFGGVENIKIMREMNIQDYTCSILGVCLPPTHEYYNKEGLVKNGTVFDVFPSCYYKNKEYSPLRNNIKVEKPSPMSQIIFEIGDSGRDQNEDIPLNLKMAAYANLEPGDTLLEGGNYVWGEASGGTDTWLVASKYLSIDNTIRFKAGLMLPEEIVHNNVRGRLDVAGSNATKTTRDRGDISFEWDVPLTKSTGLYKAFLYFTYIFDDIPPY